MGTQETTRLHDEILRLTLEQREAIRSGDLERLLVLLARRERVLASLPAQPDGAWEQTRRHAIAEFDRANETALLAWRERVMTELDRLQCGRAGLRGYRAHAPLETAFINRTS